MARVFIILLRVVIILARVVIILARVVIIHKEEALPVEQPFPSSVTEHSRTLESLSSVIFENPRKVILGILGF